jgi:hypothetical protein
MGSGGGHLVVDVGGAHIEGAAEDAREASRLLTWFGKSERPVPTTLAPAALATSGTISGVGLAMAMMMGSFAMDFTISGVTQSATETPMKTSAPRRTSASVPASCCGFVTVAISSLYGFMPSGRPV